MSGVLQKFPNDPPAPYVAGAEGIYIHTEDGRTILDATAGWCSQMVLGYSHPEVLQAMTEQMQRFCHMDHNIWQHRQMDELADLLLSRAPAGFDKVYFAGNSGSESVEAALKLSYQVHHDSGHASKSWIISRDQSYHGSTLQSIAVSERDILDFYEPMLPMRRARIPQHHPLYEMRAGESLDDYARRGANELDDKILELGADNVAAFIDETVMGQLQGDIPPAPNYWQYVREVCDRHDVHLILDEVYCGLGRSGKVYCCEWDDVTPDFVCFAKTLGAGYAPISVVVTSQRMQDIIARGQGRIQHGHTHQGYSLGVAAGLAVQKIVQTEAQLDHIQAIGGHISGRLSDELGGHPFFRDLRGRGLMISLEYDCDDKPAFGRALFEDVKENHDVLISAKWHRISLSPPFIITENEADRVLDAVIGSFRKLADGWQKKAG